MTKSRKPEVLTRHDRETGQRLYDYQIEIRWDDPKGQCLRPLPGGGFRRYGVYERIIRRYEIV